MELGAAPAGQIPAPGSALERSGVQAAVAMGGPRSVWVGRKAAPVDSRLSQNQLPKIPQKPGRRWGL